MAGFTHGNTVSTGGAQTYTLTYATVARSNPAVTSSAVVTTAATNITPYGFTQAQANAIPVAVNAVAADLLSLKALVNGIVTDLRAKGLAA